MQLNKKYLKQLTAPLKGKLGLKPSEYFAQLDKDGVEYTEEGGKLTSEFTCHMEHLIDQGVILGPCPSEGGVKSLGLKIGAGRSAAIVNSGLIKLNERTSFPKLSLMWAWLKDHILLTIITGVVTGVLVAVILKALGIE